MNWCNEQHPILEGTGAPAGLSSNQESYTQVPSTALEAQDVLSCIWAGRVLGPPPMAPQERGAWVRDGHTVLGRKQ